MKHYPIIADLFRYPDANLAATLEKISGLPADKYPDVLNEIKPFQKFLDTYNLTQQQEYYIKTFDVNALCYLDIGYILFGEDYKRGEFLVKLSQEHKTAGNDCGSELADHLPNILRLFEKAEDKKFVEELAYCLVIPALREMLSGFKNDTNVYRNILQLVLTVLETDFRDCNLQQFHITKLGKSCFTGKSGKHNHGCGMNQRQDAGMVPNPLQ